MPVSCSPVLTRRGPVNGPIRSRMLLFNTSRFIPADCKDDNLPGLGIILAN